MEPLYVQLCAEQIAAILGKLSVSQSVLRRLFEHINLTAPPFLSPLSAPFASLLAQPRIIKQGAMYTIGNIYAITAIAVVGGGLFGFDISSQSAM